MKQATVLTLIALLLVSPAATRAAEPATKKCAFPVVDQLPDNPMMPDPFKKPDGTRVATVEEWKQQRTHLKAMLEHYLYGTLPPRPTAAEVSFKLINEEPYAPADSKVAGLKQICQVTISRNSLTQSFHFSLWRPGYKNRYPTLINNFPEHGHPSPTYSMAEGVRRGYMVVGYERTEIVPDDRKNADRHAGIFRLYPEYDFYTIGAWAWAYQVVIDVLDRLEVVDMSVPR